MKKLLVLFSLLYVAFHSFGQNQGVYEINYGNGAYAKAYVYRKNVSTYLIYLDVNRGKPNYNMGGGLYTATSDGKQTFVAIDTTENYSYSFVFSKSSLVTKLNYGNLGWGYGVATDFNLKRLTNVNPLYFISVGTGKKLYFKDLSRVRKI